MPINSNIRFQAVTLLIPYDAFVDDPPETWDFTSRLETGPTPVTVLDASVTSADALALDYEYAR